MKNNTMKNTIIAFLKLAGWALAGAILIWASVMSVVRAVNTAATITTRVTKCTRDFISSFKTLKGGNRHV